VSLSPKSF